jgi:energy-coupling factor transport system substrate-specific component
MSSTTTGTTGTTDPTGPARDPGTLTASTATARWRTVDVVVASALAVAFGVVFWAWGNLWNAVQPAFTAFPPGQGFMYGVWLMPGVLGALVLRKRGAAVYVELLASIVSALLGTSWGLTVIAYGLVQGAAAEIVFAFALYKSWRLGTALLAGALAGAAAALMDLVLYYVDLGWSGAWQLTYVALLAVSSAVVAGLGSWLLVRALARTGVLAPFRSGADQARV